MQLHESVTLEVVRHDRHVCRVAARKPPETEDGEEEVLIGVCRVGFGADSLGAHGVSEGLVREDEILRHSVMSSWPKEYARNGRTRYDWASD